MQTNTWYYWIDSNLRNLRVAWSALQITMGTKLKKLIKIYDITSAYSTSAVGIHVSSAFGAINEFTNKIFYSSFIIIAVLKHASQSDFNMILNMTCNT